MKNILSANLYNKNGIWLAQQELELLETLCLFKIWDYGSCEDLYDAECKQVMSQYCIHSLSGQVQTRQTISTHNQLTSLLLTAGQHQPEAVQGQTSIKLTVKY